MVSNFCKEIFYVKDFNKKSSEEPHSCYTNLYLYNFTILLCNCVEVRIDALVLPKTRDLVKKVDHELAEKALETKKK